MCCSIGLYDIFEGGNRYHISYTKNWCLKSKKERKTNYTKFMNLVTHLATFWCYLTKK